MNTPATVFPDSFDEGLKCSYDVWEKAVFELADRHGISAKQLIGLLFEYAPEKDWRSIFWGESSRFAYVLKNQPEPRPEQGVTFDEGTP